MEMEKANVSVLRPRESNGKSGPEYDWEREMPGLFEGVSWPKRLWVVCAVITSAFIAVLYLLVVRPLFWWLPRLNVFLEQREWVRAYAAAVCFEMMAVCVAALWIKLSFGLLPIFVLAGAIYCAITLAFYDDEAAMAE